LRQTSSLCTRTDSSVHLHRSIWVAAYFEARASSLSNFQLNTSHGVLIPTIELDDYT
jgi:hypothetical protein